MSPVRIRRHSVMLQPDCSRVILRPFIPARAHSIATIIGRALALPEEEAVRQWRAVCLDFAERHMDFEQTLQAHYGNVRKHVFTDRPLSRERQLLIGALFSGEYALEAAALFNPSMVAHPDQSGVPAGDTRFILSLRATGEGHISSIEFREGTLSAEGRITLNPVSRFAAMPALVPDPTYEKWSFVIKLHEMGVNDDHAAAVMSPLGERFTLAELMSSTRTARHQAQHGIHELLRTIECIQWLADSNYELRFPDTVAISERVIFPVSPNETNGIEDARFVRFMDDDGSVMYYATYTAYNGRVILPQLIETEDFLHFRILTLNGNAVQNKGMALFPRRINGHYAMLSRQDDENLFIMFSDLPHHWNDPQVVIRPAEMWESVKIGNCGSPLETEAGWLVITHGVGPMRTYCIGAVLLDLDDPTKIIGRLEQPLLRASEDEREGYVPNVVYSCGAMIHAGRLILPFAICDRTCAMATVSLDELLTRLTSK